jgi:hypothetical protein
MQAYIVGTNPREILLGIRRSAQFAPTIIDEGWIEDMEGYDRAIRYPTKQIGDTHFIPQCTCGPSEACDQCMPSPPKPSGLRQQRWLLG